jgi:hypothetical protein
MRRCPGNPTRRSVPDGCRHRYGNSRSGGAPQARKWRARRVLSEHDDPEFGTPLLLPCGPTVLPRPANPPLTPDSVPWSTRRCTSALVAGILPGPLGPSLGRAAAWLLPFQNPSRGRCIRVLYLDPVRRAPRTLRPIPTLGDELGRAGTAYYGSNCLAWSVPR